MGLDDPALDVDGSVPKPICGVPGETIVRNRVREASICMQLILEHVTHSLAIERSVRKIRPNNKLVVRNVCGSRVPQSPFAAINDLRPICDASVPEEEPFFPTGSVLVDLEWVDANLGLEERGGGCAVWESGMVVARAVVVYGGGGW